MDFKSAIKKAHSLTDYELHQQVNTKVSTSEDHIAAKAVLEHRERHRRFWSKDLVAWLALFLAIVSLGLTAYYNVGREFPRETLLEKECSDWAKNTMRKMKDPDRSRYALLLGACMKGGR